MGEITINPIHNVHKKYRNMNLVNPYIFAPPVPTYNTYIGGVSASISTASALATKLGISVGAISNFTIVGSDIKCRITGSYAISGIAFLNTYFTTGSPTYFRDEDGLVTSLESQSFYNSLNTTLLYFPNVTSISNSTFYYSNYSGLSKATYVLPRLTSIGTTVGSDSTIFGLGTGRPTKFYCSSFLQTCNSGGVEGDLAYGITKLVTPVYVTNYTAPNPVTTLTAGTIYNTAVQLNFTPPTSVNGVDFYEVYLNNSLIPYAEITASGQFITGLNQNTNYNVTVVAVDIFYNKSVVSNVVNVSTFYNNSVDADATNYTNISGNSSFSNTIQSLFIDLKNTGLYFKIPAFYPFLGTTQAQHKWNAKNPLDTNAAFRLQFFGGGTHSNLGYQCNGTDAYANTFLVPNAVQNVNSNGLTITVGTNNVTTKNDVVEIGSLISATQSSFITTKSNNTTFRRGSKMNGVTILQDNKNDAKGIFTSVKQSSTVTKLLRNKVEIASGNSGGTLPTVSVFIGNLSLSGSPYIDGWSNQRIQFAAIHEGLTDAEVVALHTIIDNFESAIGRKTW